MTAAEKLAHAIRMEKIATTRLRRSVTALERWQERRRRYEKIVGEAEVQKIINSDAAVKAITQKRHAVQATMKRMGL